MNERIKQLMLEAVCDVDKIYFPIENPLNDEVSKMYIPDVFAEKFAELIIQECIQVALEQKQWVEDQQPTFNYNDDMWDRARIQQSQRIMDKIREHFGVE